MIHFRYLLASVPDVVWWAVPVLFISGVVKTPMFKGMIGEWVVNLAAKRWLDRGTYHLIKNVTLPTEDGTTQIDRIIVSPYGVFVVETKNMKGWIFGAESQRIWMQQFYKQKHRFQNPLRQSYRHTKALEAALGLDAGKLFPVVVFVGDSSFRTPMPENVTEGLDYVRYIKSKKVRLFSDVEKDLIIEQIESGRLTPSIRTHVEHAMHVRGVFLSEAERARIVEQAQSGRLTPPIRTYVEHARRMSGFAGEEETLTNATPRVEVTTCPHCGSAMVLRMSKKGSRAGELFWGCSTFPECRGVIELP